MRNPRPADTNVAVVGSGYWGKNLVRNFAQLRALRWICDADEGALQAQGELYPEARLTSRLDEVLADDNVQGVVIATPAVLRYEHASLTMVNRECVGVTKTKVKP